MKFGPALIFSLVLAACISAQPAKPSKTDKPFKTDNCTLFPDGNYADCCVEHDREYHVGGSLKERSVSDKKLKECVMSKGKGWKRKLLVNAIWIGVRVGGVHFLPTPFRWGFGHKWPRKEPKEPKPMPTPDPH